MTGIRQACTLVLALTVATACEDDTVVPPFHGDSAIDGAVMDSGPATDMGSVSADADLEDASVEREAPPLPSSQAEFIAGRTAVPCTDPMFKVCEDVDPARCELDETNYVVGTFPASRSVVVGTSATTRTIRVLLFLTDKRDPGAGQTEVLWFEPDCSKQYAYRLTSDPWPGNLFEKAGDDNIFTVKWEMSTPGAHLVRVTSDADASFLLRVDVF